MNHTVQQIDAARAVRAANMALTDISRREPATDAPGYQRWRTQWDAAYQRHEDAEDAYRLMFPGEVAPPVTMLVLMASGNPLRPTTDKAVWSTLDRAFVTAPVSSGGWVLDWYGVTGECTLGHTCLPLKVADLSHAQQIVDWIGWATREGCRPRAQWRAELYSRRPARPVRLAHA
ncbi:hypothetical protein [Nocardia carnea]|uniref:hypothetical protein n=1 Tax=Nocardia carnea TaxID=37328 RepID=UPI0024582394|nr:hypothetical protein [Nocardia carnea]